MELVVCGAAQQTTYKTLPPPPRTNRFKPVLVGRFQFGPVAPRCTCTIASVRPVDTHIHGSTVFRRVSISNTHGPQ